MSTLYRRTFGRAPDLRDPTTFNEKVLWKILHDRRAYLTLFSDKLRVREFVRNAAPQLALPALYWWSERAEDLPYDALPASFALKANHGSGWNLLVEKKSQHARESLVKTARRWLDSDFTIVGREWSYRNVGRAVYAEQLLSQRGSHVPDDYKLFVFNGKVRLIQVDAGRYTRHTQVLYDERWKHVAGTVAADAGTPGPPPRSLASMIASAEALSLGVDFVRVDLYDIDGTPVFGELTHSPNKGLSPFRPAYLDLLLGDHLRLDDPTDVGPMVDYDAVVARWRVSG